MTSAQGTSFMRPRAALGEDLIMRIGTLFMALAAGLFSLAGAAQASPRAALETATTSAPSPAVLSADAAATVHLARGEHWDRGNRKAFRGTGFKGYLYKEKRFKGHRPRGGEYKHSRYKGGDYKHGRYKGRDFKHGRFKGAHRGGPKFKGGRHVHKHVYKDHRKPRFYRQGPRFKGGHGHRRGPVVVRKKEVHVHKHRGRSHHRGGAGDFIAGLIVGGVVVGVLDAIHDRHYDY